MATEPHLDALAQLVASINETGNLHSFGSFYVKAIFRSLIAHRQRLDTLWQKRPEILLEAVKRPLIILGLPRSGTSLMFNLLAQDQHHRFLSNWEATASQIPPERACIRMNDPRRRTGRLLVHFQNYLAPQLNDIHEFLLDGPEECTPLLMQGFATQAFAGMFNAPAYSEWLDSADHLPTYEHHRRILQTLQFTYPGERWLLKSPDHLAAIDALIHTYPDACLVHLHRDPSQSVASWASLNAAFRGIYSRSVNPTELGAQVIQRLGNDMDAYMHQRSGHANQRFFDVSYRDLVSDPMATVRKIYSHFDFTFRADAEKRMQLFLELDRRKPRPHKYSTDQYGLTADDIQRRFRIYMNTFDVSPSR